MKYSDEEIASLQEVVACHGWDTLNTWALAQVDNRKDQLTNVDPTDTAKIAALQGEIRGIKRLFDHVSFTLAQKDKER